jgi:hypothetical protein
VIEQRAIETPLQRCLRYAPWTQCLMCTKVSGSMAHSAAGWHEKEIRVLVCVCVCLICFRMRADASRDCRFGLASAANAAKCTEQIWCGDMTARGGEGSTVVIHAKDDRFVNSRKHQRLIQSYAMMQSAITQSLAASVTTRNHTCAPTHDLCLSRARVCSLFLSLLSLSSLSLSVSLLSKHMH